MLYAPFLLFCYINLAYVKFDIHVLICTKVVGTFIEKEIWLITHFGTLFYMLQDETMS